MNIKQISSLVAVSFAATASLGVSEARSLYVIGSTLNIAGALQVEGLASAPPGVGLFADPGSTLPGTSGTGAISDATCDEDGEFCNLFVTSSTESFSSILAGLKADAITSFDPTDPSTLNNILILDDFAFSLTPGTVNILSADANGNFTFEAFGTVENTVTSATASVAFTGFSANGLLDDGVLGGDVLAGDDITGIGSYSGTIVVIPEPITLMGASLAAGLGAFFKRKTSKI